MTPSLAERKQHCSHLYQVVVDSLEQGEPMRLVRRCFAMAGEMQWWTGMH